MKTKALEHLKEAGYNISTARDFLDIAKPYLSGDDKVVVEKADAVLDQTMQNLEALRSRILYQQTCRWLVISKEPDSEDGGYNYWSNKQGWVGEREDATSFSSHEHETRDLPMGGVWLPVAMTTDPFMTDYAKSIAISPEELFFRKDLFGPSPETWNEHPEEIEGMVKDMMSKIKNFTPRGFVVLECKVLDSVSAGALTIAPVGGASTIQQVTEDLMVPVGGSVARTSMPVSYITSDDVERYHAEHYRV